ncbi:hypothetical protein NJD71_06980 [Psychrobacter sp. PP-21]|uniref:hypothetical protein n=1 Tax=Psychrobacter sp. PP-21 TaxID=2957503 RepID=UPI0029B71B0A|nr:hypothetical protein [Psychrobacter sp. PP-21]MDX2373868.1 hypothetical protein [Psychrobacter sp. PP-21]
MDNQSEPNKVESKPHEKSDDNLPKKCGIVMPIASMEGYPESHWKDVKRIIESAIKEANFEARLVSDADDIGVIHKRIVQNLYDNPMIVCDISGRNPNVMFELGLRLAFDKPTIIIKDEVTPYSFDTSVIEHLSYPKDLRYHDIEIFKENLKDRIKKTYKAYESDPENYSTFLKNYGAFKAPLITEETVSVDRYVLEELKSLQLSVNRLSSSMNSKSTNRNSKTQFVRNATAHQLDFHNYEEPNILEFYLDGIRNKDELVINLQEVLAEFSFIIEKVSFNSGKLFIEVKNINHEHFDAVGEVISQIEGLGYDIDELDHNIYRLSEGRG